MNPLEQLATRFQDTVEQAHQSEVDVRIPLDFAGGAVFLLKEEGKTYLLVGEQRISSDEWGGNAYGLARYLQQDMARV